MVSEFPFFTPSQTLPPGPDRVFKGNICFADVAPLAQTGMTGMTHPSKAVAPGRAGQLEGRGQSGGGNLSEPLSPVFVPVQVVLIETVTDFG